MLKRLVEFIESFEGFVDHVYLDVAGIKTIGIGSLWHDGMPEKITHEEAVKLCERDCSNALAAVEKYVKVPINDNQKIALVSFAYNEGVSALETSTLLKKLNSGDYKAAAEEFLKWDKARVGGKLQVVEGLTRRRTHEKELFLESP